MKKMLKYSLFIFVCISIATVKANAQNLPVMPAHLVCEFPVPEKLDTQVKSKLLRALTAYGISSDSELSRFAMVPEVVINNEHTTATTPVYCDVEFDLVISLKDIYTAKTFASYTAPGSGTGVNKTNAIAKGISAIKLNDKNFITFCEQAKQKVKDYYATNMNSILAAADAAASNRNFEEALAILAEFPEDIKGYGEKIAPKMSQLYTKEIDLQGESVLTEAQAEWAKSPDEYGAEKVSEILTNMPAGCSSVAGATQLLAQVRKRVQAINDRQFAFEKAQAEREFELQKQRENHDYALQRQANKNAHSEKMATINAAKQIGVAWAKNQPKRITKVYLW